jgi:hypothetical protein
MLGEGFQRLGLRSGVTMELKRMAFLMLNT